MADFDYLTSLGSSGSSNGQFDTLVDIAINNGYIYILDSGNARLQQLRKTGGTFVNKVEGFSNPSALCASAGIVFVANGTTVYLYDGLTLKYINKIDTFSNVSGIDSDNLYLYVLDNGVNKLYKYELSSLVVKKTISLSSSDYGRISINRKNNSIFIIDLSNNKVKVRRLSDLKHVTAFNSDVVLYFDIYADDDFIYIMYPQKIVVINYGDYSEITNKDGSDSETDNYISFGIGIFVDKDYILICDLNQETILVWQKYKVQRSLSSSTDKGIIGGNMALDDWDDLVVGGTDDSNEWVNQEQDRNNISWR